MSIYRIGEGETFWISASSSDNTSLKSGVQNPGTSPDDSNVQLTIRFYFAFAVLTVLALMVALDSTSVSVAIPVIAADIHATALESFWIGTSFLLTSTIFLLPIGALSHIFGRVSILIFSDVAFLVGIIVSGCARDVITMVVGRTIQGIGGGGILLLNEIIVTDLVPLHLRGIFFGTVGGAWALGSISGPVVGGVLAYRASWRWIFWVNIPFGAITLVAVPWCIRLTTIRGSVVDKLKRVDWLGNAILTASITAFLVPVTWGGVQYSWASWHTLVPVILGLLGLVIFGLEEVYIAKEPTVRLHLVRSYNMSYSLFATSINALIVYGALYFLPLYYEAVKAYSPLLSGVALLPATFTVAPISIAAGFIITRTGDFRTVTWFGWFTATFGCGVALLLDVDTTVVQWVFLTIVAGIGLGILFTSLSFVNQAASGDADMAFAVSLFTFCRCLGQCIGVAIGGTIFQNQMEQRLQANPATAQQASEFSKDAARLAQTLQTWPDGQEKNDIRQAYMDALKIVWATMCALSGLAFLGSLFIRKISLRRVHFTEQQFKRQG